MGPRKKSLFFLRVSTFDTFTGLIKVLVMVQLSKFVYLVCKFFAPQLYPDNPIGITINFTKSKSKPKNKGGTTCCLYFDVIAIATCIRTNQNPEERGGAPSRLSLLGFMSQQDWLQL